MSKFNIEVDWIFVFDFDLMLDHFKVSPFSVDLILLLIFVELFTIEVTHVC